MIPYVRRPGIQLPRALWILTVLSTIAACAPAQQVSVTERPQATSPSSPSTSVADPAYSGPGAGWLLVSQDSRFAPFVHTESIQRAGSIRRYWEINNLTLYAQATLQGIRGSGVKSGRRLLEYDCRTKQSRVLQQTMWSELNSRGDLLFTNDKPSEQTFNAPGSLGSLAGDLVCSR